MNSKHLLLNTGATAALLPGLNSGALLNAAHTLGQNIGQPGFANTLALQQDVALLQQQQPAALPSAAQAAAAPAADTAAVAADAAPRPESDQDAAEPVLEAQSSHVLAALGLWQPPVAAALQAVATPAASTPTAPAAPPAPVVPAMPTAAAAPDTMPAVPAESTLLTMRQTVATGAKSGVKSFGAVDSAPPASFEAALSAPSGGIDSVRPAVALASAVLPASDTGPALAPALSPALSLKGEPTQWQQPLLQALGDRLQLQIAARSEQAVIKLDPPMLGQVEIAIRQQAGELQVRMSASHGEVARQLHQLSDNLRQDLVQRHSGEVTVQVVQSARSGDDARQAGRDAQQQPSQQQAQQQDRREQQRSPGRGLHEDEVAARGFSSSLSAADIPA